jgi:hypothetical protein
MPPVVERTSLPMPGMNHTGPSSPCRGHRGRPGDDPTGDALRRSRAAVGTGSPPGSQPSPRRSDRLQRVGGEVPHRWAARQRPHQVKVHCPMTPGLRKAVKRARDIAGALIDPLEHARAFLHAGADQRAVMQRLKKRSLFARISHGIAFAVFIGCPRPDSKLRHGPATGDMLQEFPCRWGDWVSAQPLIPV